MANWTDPAFQAWLAQLPPLGYDRIWIGNNLPALRKRFDADPNGRMPECAPATVRVPDRYEEI